MLRSAGWVETGECWELPSARDGGVLGAAALFTACAAIDSQIFFLEQAKVNPSQRYNVARARVCVPSPPQVYAPFLFSAVVAG